MDLLFVTNDNCEARFEDILTFLLDASTEFDWVPIVMSGNKIKASLTLPYWLKDALAKGVVPWDRNEIKARKA